MPRKKTPNVLELHGWYARNVPFAMVVEWCRGRLMVDGLMLHKGEEARLLGWLREKVANRKATHGSR
jgi:hypothetical protein